MKILTTINEKGGTGKSTIATNLATALHRQGRKVVLIDADPNRPLEAWARLKGTPEKLQLMIDDSAETIIDTIEEARANADFVIVDLEGTATDRIGFAIARSDLVLIPLQSSVLDASEAAKSVKLVHQMRKVANREIPYRVFFTRVPPAIRERTARDIDRQFSDAAIPVLPATLIDRAAYRALFSLGGILHDLERSDVSGLESAKENGREFAQAVINVLKGEGA